jgi:hypothetical protein
VLLLLRKGKRKGRGVYREEASIAALSSLVLAKWRRQGAMVQPLLFLRAQQCAVAASPLRNRDEQRE